METFNDIVTKMFKVPAAEVRDDMSSKDIPEWDSMNYLLFIAELEKRFSMSFTMNEVMEAKTVGDLRKAVNARGKK